MADYKVVMQPLDAPLDRQLVSPRGLAVRHASVVGLSNGAAVSIHFGSGEPIPLAVAMEFDLCPAETDGVYLSSELAQPGASVQLVLGTISIQQGV